MSPAALWNLLATRKHAPLVSISFTSAPSSSLMRASRRSISGSTWLAFIHEPVALVPAAVAIMLYLFNILHRPFCQTSFMLIHYPYATVLDHPELRELVLKAVAWGPPEETLAIVAAKLLHGELLAFVASEWPESAAPGHNRGTGAALLEFDPLGVVVNVAYLAAGPRVFGPFLDELATLAQRYGFQALECYSRRPGMESSSPDMAGGKRETPG